MRRVRHMKESVPNSVPVPNTVKNVYVVPTLDSRLYGSGKKGLDTVLEERREANLQSTIVMTPEDFR